MDIITSHINADFDSLASMVAAKKLYPDAEIVFPGSQEKKLRDFLEAFQPVKIKRIKDIDLSMDYATGPCGHENTGQDRSPCGTA